ncbi:hypothetical protein DMENIID0001_045260 [Sergentomyia squamirostris]
MSDVGDLKLSTSFIELNEIRRLDHILTQCETSSCEHICRDCCEKLGSLEDCDPVEDDEVPSSEVVQPPQQQTSRPRVASPRLTPLITKCVCGAKPSEKKASTTDAVTCSDSENITTISNCRKRHLLRQNRHRSEDVPKKPPNLTVNRAATVFVCENCEKVPLTDAKRKKSIFARSVNHGAKQRSLNESNVIAFSRKYSSSEHSLRETALGMITAMGDEPGGKGRPKFSPQVISRRISTKVSEELAEIATSSTAKEALLGSRFGSFHEKKLPEPVETIVLSIHRPSIQMVILAVFEVKRCLKGFSKLLIAVVTLL